MLARKEKGGVLQIFQVAAYKISIFTTNHPALCAFAASNLRYSQRKVLHRYANSPCLALFKVKYVS